MENINTNIHCKIEAITPLHIGIGADKSWVKGLDFIQDSENKVKLLNQEALFQAIPTDKTDDFINHLAKGNIEKWHLLKEYVKKEGVIKEVFDYKYTIGIDGIKPMLRNGQGKPYIAGSSVKGAVRSILLRYLYKQLNIVGKPNEKDIFGGIDNNIMRLIRITDATFKKTKLRRVKLFNLSGENGGWKHGNTNTSTSFNDTTFTTDYEVINTQCGEGALRIGFANNFHKDIYKQIKNTLNANHKYFTEDTKFDLFSVINQHTQQYIKKQIAFFNQYDQADNVNFIIDKYNSILEMIDNTNQTCILKMSAGSGYHSIKGDWEFEDFTETGKWTQEDAIRKINFKTGNQGDVGKIKAKTRKIVFYGENSFVPMGFVKLTKINQEEYQTILNQ
jgi:CRISPR-associated protein Csm5